MSRGAWNPDNGLSKGFYRDRENGWIFGVCAGIAEFANFNVGAVRVITVICLWLFTWATGLLYLAAVLMFREKPLIYSGRYKEHEFWRCRGRDDYWSHS